MKGPGIIAALISLCVFGTYKFSELDYSERVARDIEVASVSAKKQIEATAGGINKFLLTGEKRVAF